MKVVLSTLLFMTIAIFVYTNPTYAQEATYVANLTGAAEIPPIKTNGTGIAEFTVLDDTVEYIVNVTNINNVTLAHIHSGADVTNGPIVVTLFKGSSPTGEMSGILSKHFFKAKSLEGPLAGKQLSELVNLMKMGQLYVNVETLDFKEGEIRGQISNMTNTTATSNNTSSTLFVS